MPHEAEPEGSHEARSATPHFVPVPTQESPSSGRLILRDGTAAAIRVARASDEEAVARFYASLSPRSRRLRFLSVSLPESALIRRLCESADARKQITLIVTRLVEGAETIVAVGSYAVSHSAKAEVSFAVADSWQGKGMGTLLLDRLALVAATNGIRHLWATLAFENQSMLEVFRESGFAQETNTEQGTVEIDISLSPNAASVANAESRDRISTTASLSPFFRPRCVAVVGASRTPSHIGARLLQAVVDSGFSGPIYPVNPKAGVIGALKAYPSVRDLPEAPDLAVIAVPPAAVLDAVDDCAWRGVRAVVVITAGFAEVGGEGERLQRELIEKVRGHGLRMVGPNSLGLLNTDPVAPLNASFAPAFPPPGPIAFSSQSGALGLAMMRLCRQRGLGLSNFVSVGNKADVSGNDLLQYWEGDERTGVILLYLESFGNPRRFARIASRVGRRKPIVVVKAGRTSAGKRAANSHTGALAGSDVAADALFHQTGVIRAESLDEMFDLAEALSAQPLPSGRRVALLTNAGGLGILCADACEANGMSVLELGASTRTQLQAFLPPTASLTNPIDMIASADAHCFEAATEILLCDEQVDCLIVLTIDVGFADLSAFTRGIREGVAAARGKGGSGKPVLTCIMGARVSEDVTATRQDRLPNYAFPENAARVLGKIATYAEWRRRNTGVILDFDDLNPQEARELCQSVLAGRGPGWLDAEETRAVLRDFSLPVLPGAVCRSASEAAERARETGFPVALKLSSREIAHKTEFGGVQLNLQDEEAVHAAFEAIRGRLSDRNRLDAFDGVLVQPMIAGGVELVMGVKHDPSFGPLIAFGLGGIHVEILKDVCFRVTPITNLDAREMVRAIRGFRLLEGYRGHPAADIPAIEDALLRLSRLVEEIPEISDLDFNPVIALPPGQGCRIVDARIRVGPPQ